MSGSEQDLPEPRPTTLRLARMIGERLRAPIDPEQRDALVATLVEVSTGDELAARRRGLRGPRARRLAAAAAALVVIGGAVGVAIRSSDDLPVIALAGGTSTLGPAAGAPGDAEMMRADGSPMIGLWIPTIFRFELADGVTIGAERATAWRSVPPTDLAAAAARLAATLGLPAPSPAEWDGGTLLAESEAGANLSVLATGDWYYGGPSDLWPVWACPAMPYAGDDGTDRDGDGDAPEPGPAVECTAPEPPVGVPSAGRARTLAVEFLAGVGHDDVRIIDASGDEWGAYVQAEVVLPGQTVSSGLYVSVGFAGGERVSWANGTLARIERLGDYPLIDPQAALVRLERDMNAWLDEGTPPMSMPRALPADDGDVVTSDEDSPVTILPVPELLPGPDLPEGSWEDMEPVERTVRIVSIELVTSLVWAAGDAQMLLPHYRLIDEDGGWWFVIALEDRHLVR